LDIITEDSAAAIALTSEKPVDVAAAAADVGQAARRPADARLDAKAEPSVSLA
jgi:hypothetical protein